MTVTYADEEWPSTGHRARTLPARIFHAFKAWGGDLMAAGGRESSYDRVMAGQENDLSAVAGYAQFLTAHPDMPGAHRDRFLRAMIRCCEDLRAGGS